MALGKAILLLSSTFSFATAILIVVSVFKLVQFPPEVEQLDVFSKGVTETSKTAQTKEFLLLIAALETIVASLKCTARPTGSTFRSLSVGYLSAVAWAYYFTQVTTSKTFQVPYIQFYFYACVAQSALYLLAGFLFSSPRTQVAVPQQKTKRS